MYYVSIMDVLICMVGMLLMLIKHIMSYVHGLVMS